MLQRTTVLRTRNLLVGHILSIGADAQVSGLNTKRRIAQNWIVENQQALWNLATMDPV